ncbi:MAG: aspartate carbamoyltransferase regulatory subunit [Lachnospiraceae bacterium]|nr:aspartate carbamoyltransferase regulatory subunit [Lachnospiraceae bacterium]MCR4777530.1 aspartate carbamoyltransferase regulatory subunit [Lachnospiraceae bacterium]
MLNISGLNNGVVIDHIKAGEALNLYDYLDLDRYPGCVAIIKNAKSSKMGRKDIIKIEGTPEDIDLNMLAVVSESATINIIRGGILEEKKSPVLPEVIKDIFKCKNPRCITSIEQELPHIFTLTDKKTRTYRCRYCEQAFKVN